MWLNFQSSDSSTTSPHSGEALRVLKEDAITHGSATSAPIPIASAFHLDVFHDNTHSPSLATEPSETVLSNLEDSTVLLESSYVW